MVPVPLKTRSGLHARLYRLKHNLFWRDIERFVLVYFRSYYGLLRRLIGDR